MSRQYRFKIGQTVEIVDPPDGVGEVTEQATYPFVGQLKTYDIHIYRVKVDDTLRFIGEGRLRRCVE